MEARKACSVTPANSRRSGWVTDISPMRVLRQEAAARRAVTDPPALDGAELQPDGAPGAVEPVLLVERDEPVVGDLGEAGRVAVGAGEGVAVVDELERRPAVRAVHGEPRAW